MALALVDHMKSTVIAMLVPEGERQATMLVRRANGEFAFERIDARVAEASRVAAEWSRQYDSRTESDIEVAVCP
jgi:hypothetical protein